VTPSFFGDEPFSRILILTLAAAISL